LLVLEDVHWADAATLDLIRFIARRIQRTHVLLALSYRDDEITPTHPLRPVLGDLPVKYVRRLALPRLSLKGVADLAAGSGTALPGLFAATGGNPFFVTEVLADASGSVPVTVRDAVLGRAVRLAPPARAVLDLASLMPTSADLALIAAIAQPAASAIDECVSFGLRVMENQTLRFRHELARVAVEEAIAPASRRQGHADILALMSSASPPASLAQLTHHAFLAGDAGAAVRLSPQAAHEVMARGARREAAAHCRARPKAMACQSTPSRKSACSIRISIGPDRAVSRRGWAVKSAPP
jgi:predicted ATPase